MKPLQFFGSGFNAFWKAVPFIFKHKLGWTFTIPIAMTIAILWGGWEFASWASDTVTNYILQYTALDKADFLFADTLRLLTKGFLWVVLKFLITISVSFVSGYLVLILLSPILTFVSGKTEEILTGKSYNSDFRQFVHDVSRGIVIAIRNMFYELMLNILLFISFIIPVVGQFLLIFSPLILFLISSYFYGFAFIDYYNERRQYTIRQSVRFVRANAGIALSIGSLFYLFFKIPFIGSIAGGLAAIVASVAATIAIYNASQKQLSA